jgi:hypothetical protein
VVTANTEAQLKNKTWREMAVWHRMSRLEQLFEWTATKYSLRGREDAWYASAITWNVDKPDAFAGTHERFVLFVFDEASIIPQEIWDVAYGAMTTGTCIWVVMGNPTKTDGPFIEAIEGDDWQTWVVDTRTCKPSNKTLIQEWIEKYGEDGDFVRIRVKGVKPRKSEENVLLGLDSVLNAQRRTDETFEEQYAGVPKIMAVDPAAEGGDQSAIVVRQGVMLYPIFRVSLKEHETPALYLGKIVADKIAEEKPSLVVVDTIGIGRGVYEYLINKQFRNVIPFKGNEKAFNERDYFNLRTQVWDAMAQWIRTVGCLPKDDDLQKELTAPLVEYPTGRMKLENKRKVVKRLGKSTDSADALAMTFYPAGPTDDELETEIHIPDTVITPYDWATVYDNYQFI